MKRSFITLLMSVVLPLSAFACIGCSSISEVSGENATASYSSADHHSNGNYLSAETLWELKRIGAPVISPNGEWIVAPVTRYTLDDDRAHTDLWLFKADGTVERPLTRHGSADGQPTFSPDGSRLAFVTSREGDEAAQVYILPITEPGEAIRHTEVPTGAGSISWRGEHIYFTSSVFPGKSWEEMKEQLSEDRASHVSAMAWDELPFSSFDRYLDSRRETHLYRIHQSGGDTEEISLPLGLVVNGYDVSPDESHIAIVSDTNKDDLSPKIDIYLTSPGSDEARNITPDNNGVDSNPSFSRDSGLLAFTSNSIPGFYADTNNLMIYSIETGETRNITAEWDRSVGSVVWNENNTSLFGSVSDAGTRRIYQFHVSGATPVAATEATDYPTLDLAAQTGTIVAQNHSFLHPPQLHIVNPADRTSTRIETINDDVMNNVELGRYESVTYEGYGGQEIQMWVHYPPGFDESKEYPLMLLIHGGPHSAITDGFHFRWNAQTFASWGYVTAWHNFHGSDGFGQEFTDSINPDWITRPYYDTIAATEWFKEKSWIDNDRIVGAGASYGGYLSSILLGKEHPFNTLVIHAPVYNMYSQMSADFAVHSQRFGNYWEDDGSFFEGRTIYEQISPHYYAENFHTPALLIHGLRDLRVPYAQSFELFRTLQSKGIDSRMVYYDDENHWILKPNNSIHWYGEVQRWIEKYAEPGAR